jgi:hypothetical protein
MHYDDMIRLILGAGVGVGTGEPGAGDPPAPTPDPPKDPAPAPKTFEPITSQEDLDRILGQRLNRERDKYADYDTLKAAADELQQIKAGQMTDMQRIQAEAEEWKSKYEAAEEQRSQAELQALRALVASEKGLPPKLAARLSGGTREELEADADDLLAFVPSGPRPPRPNPQQGQPSPNASNREQGAAEADRRFGAPKT